MVKRDLYRESNPEDAGCSYCGGDHHDFEQCMMTGMTTINEFLTARLDEDEAMARAATPGPWHGFDFGRVVNRSLIGAIAKPGDDPRFVGADAEHIARHDPARVLAEVEAKRRIVEQCTHGGRVEPTEASDDILDWLTLRYLAAVYSDHPDYDEAWGV